MTKKELEQIPKLHRALAVCVKELDALPESRTVADFVTGSRSEIPYDKHRILIRGTDGRCERKAKELRAREALLLGELARLEDWIAEIGDAEIPGYSAADLAEIGDLARLRYRNNMTWERIAKEYYAGEEHYESYPRQKFERFLQDHKKQVE